MNLPLEECDAFVVAASVIRGQHQRYIRDFVRRHADRLNAAPSAFVSVSGAAQARGYSEEFLRQTHWHPMTMASFAGAVAYTQYGPLLQWIMKLISRRRG